jgi:transcriptional regulator CtsR
MISFLRGETKSIMSNLADRMEEYLKKLLILSPSGYIDIKRKELANKFLCVPSQINYVLGTRFTLDKGYLVESKRGGKGYVRIKKLQLSVENLLSTFPKDLVAGGISEDRARGIIQRLYELKYISLRESGLMESALSGLKVVEDNSFRKELRGLLLRDMLLLLIKF